MNKDWDLIKILKINIFNNNFFNLIFKADINNFKSGQFGKLKINYKNKNYIRAYSYINSTNNENLEFYIKKIKNGIVSKYLYNINEKNKNINIYISKKSYGLLILDNIKKCNNLWMFATGTGIGPYISILNSKNLFKISNKLILIYSIKYINDFNYLDVINNIKNNLKNKFKFIILTSREKNKNTINSRIDEIIKNNKLEKILETKINNNDYFMLCGNPNMIEETKQFLIDKKKINTNNIITEKYWK